MIDRVMAVIGLMVLFAFLVVVPVMVPHLDLILVISACAALATYDVWRHLVGKQS